MFLTYVCDTVVLMRCVMIQFACVCDSRNPRSTRMPTHHVIWCDPTSGDSARKLFKVQSHAQLLLLLLGPLLFIWRVVCLHKLAVISVYHAAAYVTN